MSGPNLMLIVIKGCARDCKNFKIILILSTRIDWKFRRMSGPNLMLIVIKGCARDCKNFKIILILYIYYLVLYIYHLLPSKLFYISFNFKLRTIFFYYTLDLSENDSSCSSFSTKVFLFTRR